jgi:hypothetical protein
VVMKTLAQSLAGRKVPVLSHCLCGADRTQSLVSAEYPGGDTSSADLIFPNRSAQKGLSRTKKL